MSFTVFFLQPAQLAHAEHAASPAFSPGSSPAAFQFGGKPCLFFLLLLGKTLSLPAA
jgi:hypothetical protein